MGADQLSVLISQKGCRYAAQWSPNGQWIACPQEQNIALLTPDGKMSRMVGGRSAMVTWSRDSKALFTLDQDENQKWLFTSIDINSGAEKTITTMGAGERFWSNFSNASMISMSPDGKSVAATSNPIKSDVWILEGFPHPRSWVARLFWWR